MGFLCSVNRSQSSPKSIQLARWNGDGKILRSKLGDALKTLGSEVSFDELQRVMTYLDTDNDGFINFKEFVTFCHSSSRDEGIIELHNTVELYDQDQNGLISTTELHCVLNRLRMSYSIEDCHRMIKLIDSIHHPFNFYSKSQDNIQPVVFSRTTVAVGH